MIASYAMMFHDSFDYGMDNFCPNGQCAAAAASAAIMGTNATGIVDEALHQEDLKDFLHVAFSDAQNAFDVDMEVAQHALEMEDAHELQSAVDSFFESLQDAVEEGDDGLASLIGGFRQGFANLGH